MSSTHLFTTRPSTEEQVLETSVEAKPAVGEARRGFWGALHWRMQNTFWNYMGLQAQVGLYGSTDEYGDT